jgi:hypothetical protein
MSRALVVLGVVVILIQNAPATFNAFGTDGAGVDRYRLLPLTSAQVFVSKNLAVGAWAAVQLLPVIVACAVRMSIGVAGTVLLGGANLVLAQCICGNLCSLRFATPRPAGGVESIEQSGGLWAAVVTLAVATALGILVEVCGEHGMRTVLGVQFACIGLGAAVYAATVRVTARQFEAQAPALRQRLAT